MRSWACVCACLLSGAAAPLQASDPWIKLSNSHFELYTTGDEQQARAALIHFEQARRFFLQASPFHKGLDKPVQVVAFHSAEEYRPYHPSESAASFYTRDNDHDSIVIQDLSPDHFIYAIHEYTHLVLARSGVLVPVWMNEGWADLNSTLKWKGRKAMIGDVIPGRRDALLQHTWIPLKDLDTIDQRSPLYNERDKASVFYGESWALMHMLFLSPQYRKNFDPFVRSILAGNSLAASCEKVLGKSASLVQTDLAKYIDGNQLYGASFEVQLAPDEDDAKLTPIAPLESGLLLADLLALTHKFTEANSALEALASEYPTNARVQESLGYLDLKRGEQARALSHLRSALRLGSTNAVMCFRLAVILSATSSDRDTEITALRRALQLEPDYADARLALAVTLIQTQDFAGSLTQLQAIRKIPEIKAPWFFSASAIVNSKLGHPEEARKNADLARKWAKTPAQTSQVDQIFRYLDGNSSDKPRE